MSITGFLIILAASLIELIILFYLIRGATRSNSVIELQAAQLKILIETANKKGVEETKIAAEKKLLSKYMIRIGQKRYNAGEITKYDFDIIRQEYA